MPARQPVGGYLRLRTQPSALEVMYAGAVPVRSLSNASRR